MVSTVRILNQEMFNKAKSIVLDKYPQKKVTNEFVINKVLQQFIIINKGEK